MEKGIKKNKVIVLTKAQQVELTRSLLSEMWENEEIRQLLKELILKILAELGGQLNETPETPQKESFWKKLLKGIVSILPTIISIFLKGKKGNKKVVK